MDDLESAINNVLIEWSTLMGEKMQESLTNAPHGKYRGHVDAAGGGALFQAAGVLPEITSEGDGALRIQISLPDYYSYLNHGRRATGKGGTGSLRESLQGASGWIARKGINVKQITGLKNSIKANKALAFIISRKIHEKGFEPSHWFNRVWGGDPVPEDSKAMKDLEERLAKVINMPFVVKIIDPNTP